MSDSKKSVIRREHMFWYSEEESKGKLKKKSNVLKLNSGYNVAPRYYIAGMTMVGNRQAYILKSLIGNSESMVVAYASLMSNARIYGVIGIMPDKLESSMYK